MTQTNNGTEAKTRKPPTYKLTSDQLAQQVIALETKDMQMLKADIDRELNRRKEELTEKLKELG